MKAELVVIGAGPAGCAAAVAAGSCGLSVLLVDELVKPGSHYNRSPFPDPAVSEAERAVARSIQALSTLDIQRQTGTTVWGVEGKTLFTRSEGGTGTIEFDQLIVATGAREFMFPFAGWDLPGVMSLGGLQMLLKNRAVAEQARAIVVGSSPLVLKVAHEAVGSGLQLLEVDLHGSFGDLIPRLLRLGTFPDKLAEASRYLSGLLRAGVPIRFNRSVLEAIGPDCLQAVKVGDGSSRLTPLESGSERLQLDLLAAGNGFVPNIELTELLGCAHRFDPEAGGWVVEVDSTMQTSVGDVFAAGETAGIAGALCALVEGSIAGFAAAHERDQISSAAFHSQLEALAKRRKRERRFGRAITRLSCVEKIDSSGWRSDLVLCRCERVRWGELQGAFSAGVRDVDELKNWLRFGQGFCQGRTCGPILTAIMEDALDCAPDELGRFRSRPPIKPLPVGELAGGGFAH